jgi:post-segregation antitoxin (ccd killing protein)
MRSASPLNKTTVYLGGDLMARVYDLRSRGVDINVSKVCQLAIEQALQEAEGLTP